MNEDQHFGDKSHRSVFAFSLEIKSQCPEESSDYEKSSLNVEREKIFWLYLSTDFHISYSMLQKLEDSHLQKLSASHQYHLSRPDQQEFSMIVTKPAASVCPDL